jgi:hypothetical protein
MAGAAIGLVRTGPGSGLIDAGCGGRLQRLLRRNLGSLAGRRARWIARQGVARKAIAREAKRNRQRAQGR